MFTMRVKNLSGSAVQRRVAVGVLLALSAVLSAFPASADTLASDGLNLGNDLNYAVIDLGNGTTFGWNTGPVTGNVLVGNGVTLSMSGGNNGGIVGGSLFTDGTASISGSLQNPVTPVLVSTSVTSLALSTAQTVSNTAASLTATQTFWNITGTTTITGNGGLNVIDVANIQNAPLTLKGTVNDVFVINISGSYQTNRPMTLSGGVLASNVLFNFTWTSGNVFQTSGGDQNLDGIFLATNGGQYNFSQLGLNGELINTAGNVQLVSGSEVTAVPGPVPEAGTISLLACGLLVLLIKLNS